MIFDVVVALLIEVVFWFVGYAEKFVHGKSRHCWPGEGSRSMSNLHINSGFLTGGAARGNRIYILSSEFYRRMIWKRSVSTTKIEDASMS